MEQPSPEETQPMIPEDQSKIQPTMLGSLVDLFKANIFDTLAYVILTVSLILSFFHPFLGGAIVGTIIGLYFSPHFFRLLKEFKEFLLQEGIFRGFIIIAAIAALLISATGLSIGLLFGIFVRPIFGTNQPKEHEAQEHLEPPKSEEVPTEKPPEEPSEAS